jgi:hypothetical protein
MAGGRTFHLLIKVVVEVFQSGILALRSWLLLLRRSFLHDRPASWKRYFRVSGLGGNSNLT